MTETDIVNLPWLLPGSLLLMAQNSFLLIHIKVPTGKKCFDGYLLDPSIMMLSGLSLSVRTLGAGRCTVNWGRL